MKLINFFLNINSTIFFILIALVSYYLTIFKESSSKKYIFFGIIFMLFSLLVSIIHIIYTLLYVSSNEYIGPPLHVALLVSFYGVVVSIISYLIYKMKVKK